MVKGKPPKRPGVVRPGLLQRLFGHDISVDEVRKRTRILRAAPRVKSFTSGM
jgi:hypothetical protein